MRWGLVLVVALVLLPFSASGQTLDVEPVRDLQGWVTLLIPVVIAIASAVSAAMPDSKMGGVMASIVNFLALNFGNAKNDPKQS